MIDKLIKIANKLDQKGLYREASLIDKIIKMAISQSGLIQALKNDNQEQAKYELMVIVNNSSQHATPAQEMGIDEEAFKHLKNSIWLGELERAREIMGMGGNYYKEPAYTDKVDTNTTNPFTGKPWPSGPVSQPEQSKSAIRGYIKNVVEFVKTRGGKIRMATSEGEDNLLRIEFAGLGNDDAQEFEDVFGDELTLKDDKMGYAHAVAGIIDDGPMVGVEMEVMGDEKLEPSLLNYIKDLLR